jgi:hypothetical protein
VHIARQEERIVYVAFYLENLMKREALADLGIDGRIILK